MKKSSINNQPIKVLSLIMGIILLLGSLPLHSIAIGISDIGNSVNCFEEKEAVNEYSNPVSEKEVVKELEDLREENGKQYLLNDGTVVSFIYANPVHIKDEENKWQDINNTIVDKNDSFQIRNDREITFSKNNQIDIAKDEYELRIIVLNSKESEIVVDNPKEIDSRKIDDVKRLDNLTSKLTYKDVLNNVDLEYTLIGKNIKENIILKDRIENPEIRFRIQTKNLELELEDNAVIIRDKETKEIVDKIPPVFMYDKAGAFCHEVVYTLERNEDEYVLSVIPDNDWLMSEERLYPVIIDPTIVSDTNNTTDVTVTYVNDIQTSIDSTGVLYVGKTSSNQEKVAYIKFPSTFNTTSYMGPISITNAKINLYNLQTVNPTDFGVVVYESINDFTQNGTYAHSQNPLDYVKAVSTDSLYSLDITELFERWYNGTSSNNGVCLKGIDSDNNSYAVIASTENLGITPILEYSYVHTRGVKTPYEYYTYAAAKGNNSYINSVTGQITNIQNIFTTSDEIMPYTLFFVDFGYAFKPGYVENVYKAVINGETYYTWERADDSIIIFSPLKERDANGTYHYYVYNDSGTKTQVNIPTKFYDEDGLGLTLQEISSSQICIKDDEGNKRVFVNGMLNSIEDKVGNKRNITYTNSSTIISLEPLNSNTQINQLEITSSNNQIVIDNYQTGVSATITKVSNQKTIITYSYPSNATYEVSYNYDSDGRVSFVFDEETESGLEYTYDTNGKVRYIKEIALDENSVLNYGQVARIDYLVGQTKYTTFGSDNTENTNDDISTVYVYDRSGRVVTSYTYDYTGENVYGSSSAVYNDKYTNQNVGVKKHNSVKNKYEAGKNSVNLLKNPTFENGSITPWTSYGALVSHDSDETGINNINCAELIGDSYMMQSVNLNHGEYTFSLSLKKKYLSSGDYVKLKVFDSNFNLIDESSNIYKNSSNSWEKEELNFSVINGGTYIVSVELSANSSSHLLADDIMLEKSSGIGTLSLYENGDFNESINTSNAQNATVTSVNGMFGDKGLELSSTLQTSSYYKYTVYTPNGFEINNWVVSAWARAESSIASANTDNSESRFGIKIVAHYRNYPSYTEEQFIEFNPKIKNYQFVSKQITVSPDIEATIYTLDGGQLEYIDIYLCYDKNIGTATFDLVSINRLSGATSYEYNELGKIESVVSLDGNKVEYGYDANNAIDVSNITDTYGNEIDATYDSNHNVTSTTLLDPGDNTKYTTTYSYEGYGRISGLTITSGNKSLVKSSTYKTDTTKGYFSKVESVTDENGITNTNYYYDNGLLKGVLDEYSKGIIYTYNSYGELIYATEATYNTVTNDICGVTNATGKEYSYDAKHNLESIETDTNEYSFEYDIWGNVTGIYVGNIQIASYSYGNSNGNLNSYTYGNGATISYTYDKIGRVIGICSNGIQTAKYVYASDGNISSITDIQNGTKYQYYYDGSGKLINERRINSDNETTYNMFYEYTDKGQISTKWTYYYDDSSEVTVDSYTYNSDGTLSKIRDELSLQSYSYDNFGRTTSKQTTKTNGINYSDNYHYFGTSSITTGLIDYVETFISSEEYVTEYTYDNKGNISCIGYIDLTNSPNVIYNEISYEYDSKNQLIRENNELLGETYTYEYDLSGNITSKTTWNYTTSPISNNDIPKVYEEYGYDTVSGWGDQRVSYIRVIPSTQSVITGNTTYDLSGNPLTYYNGEGYTFTWSKGKELSSLTKNNTIYSYGYNQDGIRISKATGSTRVEYELDGTKILREKQVNTSTNTLIKDTYYFYDRNGYISSAKITYGGNTYSLFFRTNLQGDVLSIYKSNGDRLVDFEYDAWGNFTETTLTTSTETTLALQTPFRYRGYVYDSETSLYYLNSRYYDSKLCRFISSDTFISTGIGLLSSNTFAYCENNPVMFVDYLGHFAIVLSFLFGACACAAAAGVIAVEQETHVIAKGIDKILDGIDCLVTDINNYFNPTIVHANEEPRLCIIYELITAQFLTCQIFIPINENSRKYDEYEYHHIVARGDHRAKDSHLILKKHHIDINGSDNIVKVKKEWHCSLHTDEYYLYLKINFQLADTLGGKEGVLKMLKIYKSVLGNLQ